MTLYGKVSKFIKVTIDGDKYERKINEQDVYDASDKCPTCGSFVNRRSVCNIQSNPTVEFLYCPICKGCSASKMPTQEFLSSYYGKYYDSDDKEITFPGQLKRFANHIYKYLSINNKQNSFKILDFGGGDGSLAIEVCKILLDNNPNVKKIKVVLVDYQEQKNFSNESIEFIAKENLEQLVCNFDLIIASAILEHIPELDGVLRKLFSHLSVGGYFYIRVPYLLPLKKIFPNIPLLYPMHVHDLGPSFWNRIINRYKLDATIVASRPPLAETEFNTHFIYTLLSYLFKSPAYLEMFIRKKPIDFIWNLVAGWELVVKKKSSSE